MEEKTITGAILSLANSPLYLALHKFHDLCTSQQHFIVNPSGQVRKLSPGRLHGLSKIKHLVNAELGLRPKSDSKIQLPNQHAMLGALHIITHSFQQRFRLCIYSQESGLNSKGLSRHKATKPKMEPVLPERT